MPSHLKRGALRLFPAVCALIATGCLAAAAVNVDNLPKPTGYVSDLAHVVDAQSKDTLENFCTQVERQLGVQFAFVTIDTIGDKPIRDFALELARKWGVGSKKDNQGVLLLLVINDRKSDIETGRGIEPYLTDGFSGSTLRAMRPDLRAGDYGRALLVAAQTMAGQIAQGKGMPFSALIPSTEQPVAQRRRGGGGIPFPLLILGIFVLLWLLGRGARRGGGSGCLTGFLLGNLFGGGRGGWGGGWGGGGFGGGSGGGGGFGGFGGGDFGGGGASSNW